MIRAYNLEQSIFYMTKLNYKPALTWCTRKHISRMRVPSNDSKVAAERDGMWPYHMALCNLAHKSKNGIKTSHKWHLSGHRLQLVYNYPP